jgi:hypothetical protein
MVVGQPAPGLDALRENVDDRRVVDKRRLALGLVGTSLTGSAAATAHGSASIATAATTEAIRVLRRIWLIGSQ